MHRPEDKPSRHDSAVPVNRLTQQDPNGFSRIFSRFSVEGVRMRLRLDRSKVGKVPRGTFGKRGESALPILRLVWG